VDYLARSRPCEISWHPPARGKRRSLSESLRASDEIWRGKGRAKPPAEPNRIPEGASDLTSRLDRTSSTGCARCRNCLQEQELRALPDEHSHKDRRLPTKQYARSNSLPPPSSPDLFRRRASVWCACHRTRPITCATPVSPVRTCRLHVPAEAAKVC
jgi:hypothetical protein